jgi:C-terminal processing protease CtpA/Prc
LTEPSQIFSSKNAKTEEHLKSLMQMVDNLLKTNNDVNDAYKERINIAFRRKTDELGNYLSKKEFDKIMGGIDRDVKYGDESEEIKESIAKSIDWFKKLLK